MKKLNRNQIQFLAQTIQTKVYEKKSEQLEKVVSKTKEYKALEKLIEKQELLNKQLTENNAEMTNLANTIRAKYKANVATYKHHSPKFTYYGTFNTNIYNDIYNELMLSSIGNDFDVNKMIEKMVAKYSV